MKFESMKEIIVRAAKEAGLDEYELYYYADEDMSVGALKQEIDSFSSGNSQGIDFRCKVNGKMGYASTELFEEEELTALVSRAMENAKSIESDDEVDIFPGSPKYEKVEIKEPPVPNAAQMTEVTLALQNKVYSLSDKIADGTRSSASCGKIETCLYNSYGLELTASYGLQYGVVQVNVKDGDEASFGFEVAEGATMEELGEIADKAVAEALSKLGAGLVETGHYPIVISGKQMRSLLSTFSSVFSSRAAQKGLSLLAGKEGEKIAADCVTIMDDPFRPGSIQAAFDGEGVATSRKCIVENGTLNTLLYNLSTAKKAGRESTGNGARHNGIRFFNFYIAAGEASDEELLRKANGGIYITEVKGLHAGANATTGDFSIESAGFMIEDGKLGRPVKSFTIAGNFFELLKQIDTVGNDVKFGISGGSTMFGSPDVYIPQMSVAGK
ncbi:MAG: TldD/PmbA family protein [Clostridia bacterium]|nr:TldD/PmbA family protein [Clostridia bacterium]